MVDLAANSDDGIVVVHSSDIHVDDGYTARAHGGDGTRGLRCVLATAAALGADVVLLAGDVFEHNRLPQALLDRTVELLTQAAVPIVILPGNHDPLTPDSAYERGAIHGPDNVHVIGLTQEQSIKFPRFDLEVWGQAHRDYGNMAPLAAARPRTTRWQIVMAHGHYEAAAEVGAAHRPSWLIHDHQITATEADYVALGHWNRAVRVGNGHVPAYYSGSPDLANTVNLIRLKPDGTVAVAREEMIWD